MCVLLSSISQQSAVAVTSQITARNTPTSATDSKRNAARFAATVLFPTPPFPLITMIL